MQAKGIGRFGTRPYDFFTHVTATVLFYVITSAAKQSQRTIRTNEHVELA